MSDASWWQEQLRDLLSQGDVVAELPFCMTKIPPVYLKDTMFKGNRQGWEASPKPVLHQKEQRFYALAATNIHAALVLSHDCEIDKVRNSRRVLVAPVLPLADQQDESMRQNILAQAVFGLMPLPDIPILGTRYADMRLTSSLPIDVVEAATRVGSMSDAARDRLQAQLVAFYARKEKGEGI